MARKLIVELIADPRAYTAGLKKAGAETKAFEAEFSKVTRGVLSGSGAFEHLGRSIAFASGGFLAFAGATEFLRSSVDAAREAGVAQRSLAAQMKASGEAFDSNRERIEKVATSYGKFGFQNDEVIASLTVLERGTGSINRAISLQGLTADLARAKNIGLADAANTVAKVFGGQETALRRAVPGLDKHAHGLALIAEAQQRLKGQAAANTTAAEQFGATLHDTQEIIGTALLPTLNKFLTALGDWLQKMNESGRLQKDVNAAVKVATEVFGGLKEMLGLVNSVTGSTKNTVRDLFAVFVAFKAVKFASELKLIATSIGLIGDEAAAAAPKVGAFEAAAGGAPALGSLGQLGKYGALGIAGRAGFAATSGNITGSAADSFLAANGKAVPGAPGVYQIGSKFYRATGSGTEQVGNEELQQILERYYTSKARPASAKPAAAVAALTTPKPPPGASAMLRYRWFDSALSRQLDRVQDIPTLQGQVGRLQQISAEISKRISVTKDITRKLNLEDQLAQVQRTIRGDREQIAQNITDKAKAAADAAQAAAQASKERAAAAQQAMFDRLQLAVDRTGLTATQSDDLKALEVYKATLEKIIATQGSTLDLQRTLLGVELSIQSVQAQRSQARKDAAQKAAQDAQQAAQAAATRRDTLQFRLLGLGPTGGAIVPGVANLTKRLAGIREAVAGTFLDTKQTGQQLAHIGKILSGQFGSVSETVRAAIDQMYQSIRDKLKSHTGDQTKFTHISSQKFVESLGLNLTGAQKRAIESRFATVGAGGTVPGGHSGQFTGGVVISGDVHVHGVHDIKAFENEIAKRAKARPHTRRGA